MKRVLKAYMFTENDSVKNALQEYEENNNPILLFLKELEIGDIVNKTTRDVFSRYQLFCAENNFNAMSGGEFSKAIRKRYSLDIIDRKVNGKKYRVFAVKGGK